MVISTNQHSKYLCSCVYCNILECPQEEPLLAVGYCATYNDHTNLVSLMECPYFQPNSYNITLSNQESALLPKNLSQVNDYIVCMVHWTEKVLCVMSVLMALVPQWPHLGTNVSHVLMLGIVWHSSCLLSCFRSQSSTSSFLAFQIRILAKIPSMTLVTVSALEGRSSWIGSPSMLSDDGLVLTLETFYMNISGDDVLDVWVMICISSSSNSTPQPILQSYQIVTTNFRCKLAIAEARFWVCIKSIKTNKD